MQSKSREVTKRFGAHVAVNALSLDVRQGVIYGFLGPNGAGKTTTLRMITGILDPDAGDITVLDGLKPAAARNRMGYLPEEKGLYKDMRVGSPTWLPISGSRTGASTAMRSPTPARLHDADRSGCCRGLRVRTSPGEPWR